ncbi:MAG: hypothetical protein N4J56_007312 [Chroococcidiopsis sp. SAG 2025]|nr:hypothetical protein [Chroococcidiopsis sp. SAG 2025]MDV2997607.1 hypothetical protein [Chroococcidiopsis sp. SAG 2025]
MTAKFIDLAHLPVRVFVSLSRGILCASQLVLKNLAEQASSARVGVTQLG